MCFGGGTTVVDKSADYAREEAVKREQRIRTGQGSIDQAFTPFNDNYFQNYQQKYLDVYNPQVDEQYKDTQQDLRYGLARTGMQNSTPGIRQNSKLSEAYGDRRRELGANALTATNQLRGQVEENKSNLYQMNTAAADPSLAALGAVARAGALQTVPSYSPLGDLFAGVVNAGANYYQGYQNRLPPGYAQQFQQPNGPTGYGSGRVLG